MADFLPLVTKRGDTLRRPIACTDVDGQPLNLSGATIAFHLREVGGEVDVLPGHTLTPLDAPNGLAELLLLPGQTTALAAAVYFYEVEATRGPDVLTQAEGVLMVLPDHG